MLIDGVAGDAERLRTYPQRWWDDDDAQQSRDRRSSHTIQSTEDDRSRRLTVEAAVDHLRPRAPTTPCQFKDAFQARGRRRRWRRVGATHEDDTLAVSRCW